MSKLDTLDPYAVSSVRLNPALTAMLGKLNEAEVLWLLGEIVEPSILCPFDLDNMDEQFLDAMHPVTAAYQGAFSQLDRFASAALHGERVS